MVLAGRSGPAKGLRTLLLRRLLKVGKWVKSDIYPLPRHDDAFSCVQNSNGFDTLNAMSAYVMFSYNRMMRRSTVLYLLTYFTTIIVCHLDCPTVQEISIDL